jgi:hypothetical protein
VGYGTTRIAAIRDLLDKLDVAVEDAPPARFD